MLLRGHQVTVIRILDHFLPRDAMHKRWKMHDIVFNYRADFAETGGLA